MNVLLLEDEESIRSFIKLNMIKEGYNVYEAVDGQEAITIIDQERINIAVLDIMVPALNGIEVLKKIRKKNQSMGVIMLSAKSLQKDKIEGLTYGADDYITKPFSPKELMLRIKVLSKRLQIEEKNTIESNNFLLNMKERKLYKKNIFINMTQTELELIKYFLENPNIALSKDQILNNVWGDNYVGSINTLDVNVSRLRRKIEKDPSKPIHIITVWGYGYKWEDK